MKRQTFFDLIQYTKNDGGIDTDYVVADCARVADVHNVIKIFAWLGNGA